jgi:hypothetical protein
MLFGLLSICLVVALFDGYTAVVLFVGAVLGQWVRNWV